MSLADPRIVFGIHQITPYARATGLPYGTLLVVGGGTLNFGIEREDLFGGSQSFPWASERKNSTAEFSASVKSLPDFLFELFLGATVTTVAASATGTVSTLTNVYGTLIAAVGLASVSLLAGSTAELKTGKYIIKAASATTVDVYALNSVDFDRGTDLDFVNDALKITTSALTVISGGDVTIPYLGIKITGGAGTIGMTTGDTATFEVTKPHGGKSSIVIGQSASTFPEHGEYIVAEKRSTGEVFEIDVYRAVGSGFPLPLAEKAFSIQELTVKLLYDSAKNAVAKFTAQTKEA